MRLRLVACVISASAIAGPVCQAQAFGDVAARTALVFTTVGALPPIMTSTLEAEAQRGVAVSLRYGYLPSSAGLTSVNNGGATVIFPAGPRSTVSLTGGVYDASCHDCDPGLMLSVAGDTRLGETPFGTRRERSRIIVGLNGELGFTKPRSASVSTGSLVSAAVGIPISVVSGGRARDAMRIVPFVTPGFGFGGIRGTERVFIGLPNGSVRGDDADLNGTRFMLGGGLGFYNRSSTVSLTVGFQYVALHDADPQFGVALTLGGR